MSACTPPLIWLLRDHADERELVINEGDDAVRAAYENEEKVYDQEADRLLDAAASALVGWLASPFKNPLHDREGKVDYLAHPPKEAQECTGFCIQENWAQLREREITEAAWGPCTRYLLNPEPMQKAGVRAAKLAQVCRALHRLFAQRSAKGHRAHLRRKDACYAAALSIVASSREDWRSDCFEMGLMGRPRRVRAREPMKKPNGQRPALVKPVSDFGIQFVSCSHDDKPCYGVDVLQLDVSNIRASTTSKTVPVKMLRDPRKGGMTKIMHEKMTVETVEVAFDVALVKDCSWEVRYPSAARTCTQPSMLRRCDLSVDSTRNFLGRTVGGGSLLGDVLGRDQFDTSLIGSLGSPSSTRVGTESATFVVRYEHGYGKYDGMVVEEGLPVGWNYAKEWGQRKPSKLLKLPSSIDVEIVFCTQGGVRWTLRGVIADVQPVVQNVILRNLQRRLLADIPPGAIDLVSAKTSLAAQRVIDYAQLPAGEKQTRTLKGVTVLWQDYSFDVPTPRPLGPAAAAEEEEI